VVAHKYIYVSVCVSVYKFLSQAPEELGVVQNEVLHTQHTNIYSAQLTTFQMPKNKRVNILTWIKVNLIKLEFEIILFCLVRVEKHVLIFLIKSKFKLYWSIIRPIVTHACETWVLKEIIKKQVNDI
jgi:hypothetical protein